MLAVPIRLIFALSIYIYIIFFFLAINSASLWDPNYRLVLNFVLFLHQLGWSQRLLFVSTHGPGPRVQLPEHVSQVCKQLWQGTWHLDLEVIR